MTIETRIEDGTEFRKATVRVREGGIGDIMKEMSDGGYCFAGGPRVIRTGDSLYFEFLFNLGKHADGGIHAMGMSLFIPLTPEEQLLNPPDDTPKDTTSETVQVP